MITNDCEAWDNGRVIIKQRWCDVFKQNALTDFTKIKDGFFKEIAKSTREDRITTRLELDDKSGLKTTFYLKWHGAAPFKDYLKPLLQLKKPIIGAANEWEAMHWLRDAGVPSMEPVAFGRNGVETFVISRGLENGIKLSEWFAKNQDELLQEAVVNDAARIIQRMHQAGYYHQDLYLGHILLIKDKQDYSGIWRPWEQNTESEENNHHFKLYLLDLGRVNKPYIFKKRWQVKDLAQLLYSARHLSKSLHARFAHTYFGTESLNFFQKRIIKRVHRKAARIERHTKKQKL